MKGAYGSVTVDGSVAVKRTALIEDEMIMGCNIAEAALGLTVCCDMENIIQFHSAKCAGNNIEITMDRGFKTLHQYIVDTTFEERMMNIGNIVTALLRGLSALHTRGIAHCDFKTPNIIMAGDDTSLDIIDLGAMRYVERAQDGEEMDVFCTYVFAAPEALEPGAKPTFENDAWSLGAILCCYVYGVYPVVGIERARTRQEALNLHKESKQRFLSPHGINPWIHKMMVRLLSTDPKKRPRITELYSEWTGELPLQYEFILDQALPADDDRDRDADIDDLYEMALSPGSFPLAVSIRDRSGATGVTELEACSILAHSTLFPDQSLFVPSKQCSLAMAMKKIINRVDFALYSDTAEWVLRVEHGIERPDPKVLKEAIKIARGDTMSAVQLYIGFTA